MKTPSEIHAEVGSVIGLENSKYGYRAFTESDIAKIIADAKADEKGVCEWQNDAWNWSKSSCEKLYYTSEDFKFCPGCGKEIKVV